MEGSFGSQILKAPYLKHLYEFLLQISSEVLCCEDGAMFTTDYLQSCHYGKINFSDISALSDFMFRELDTRFAWLMLGKTSDSSAESAPYDSDERYKDADELVLLFRCCLVMLLLLEFNLTLLKERCKIIFRILRELLNVDSKQKIIECEGRKISDKGTTDSRYSASVEPFNGDLRTSIHFKCLFLEVIADEILLHKNLGRHLRIIDLLSEEPEKLFASPSAYADVGFIMDIIGTHFVLSLSEKGYGQLYESLFWSSRSGTRCPLVSLAAILTILGNAIQFSLAHIVQMHIMLLCSSHIGIALSSTYEQPTLNYHMAAFDKSVDIYVKIFHNVKLANNLHETNAQPGYIGEYVLDQQYNSLFESFVQSAGSSRIKHHMSRLAEHYNNYSYSMISEHSLSQESVVMTYVEEIQHIMKDPFRQEIFLFLKHTMLIPELRRAWTETFDKIEIKGWQTSFYVASVLKLMSSSLLHIIWTFDGTGISNSKSQQKACSKACDHISRTISSFVDKWLDLVAKMLDFPMEYSSADHTDRKETLMMLTHFVGLFIYSFNSGITCLWKSSIFMVVILLKLVILNQGNLEALKLFSHVEKWLASPHFVRKAEDLMPMDKISQVRKMCSNTIASNFLAIQALHLKEESACLTHEIHRIEYMGSWKSGKGAGQPDCSPLRAVKDEDYICRADSSKYNELYLRCVGCNETEVDELADFIDYNPGKDYAEWMKNKKKYMDWKSAKSLAARRKQRMKTWYLLSKTKQKRR